MRKNVDFGVVFGGQNHEKSRKNGIEKHVFFGHRYLCVFLRILAILDQFWEARAPPKIGKKSTKTTFCRFWSALSFERGFWERFGRILEGFLEDFRTFWEDFLNEFGSILH